jgi:putative copper export protein
MAKNTYINKRSKNMNNPKLSSEQKQLQKEAHELVRQFQLILATALLVLAGGMVFYHYVEDLRWVDSLYFSVISFTTVGYGDIAPKTDAGKLFTSFYVILGIAIFGALINNLIKSRIAKRTLDNLSQLTKKSE